MTFDLVQVATIIIATIVLLSFFVSCFDKRELSEHLVFGMFVLLMFIPFGRVFGWW